MVNYELIRTDTADSHIHSIVLDVAERFGVEVAMKKLDELEEILVKLQKIYQAVHN